MAGLGQQVELVDGTRVEEHLALLPGDALVEQDLAETQTIHDLERSLRPADGAAAIGEVRPLVDDDAAVALLGEVEGRNQSDRPGADDDDGVMRRLGAVLVGRAPVREDDLADVGHFAAILDTL